MAALAEARVIADLIDHDANVLRKHLKLTPKALFALADEFVSGHHERTAEGGFVVPQIELIASWVLVAKSVAIKARDAIEAGDALTALRWVGLGQRLLLGATGNCLGLSMKDIREAAESARIALAKKAATASHSEHRSMKAQVLDHYRANQSLYPSKDVAAEAIARKLVPVSYRTVRNWLTVPKAKKS